MSREAKHRPKKGSESLYCRYGKRAIDIALSSAGIIVTLPANAVIGIATYFDVGRPIFFKQERLGKDGKVFTLVKFRNMTNETDEHGELLPPEQRVTKFGALMRKTSLDELLNFWSVLKGDMSIIGPRPLLVQYGPLYSERHGRRMEVRPGLECPTLRRIDHELTWQERFENDVWYVDNVSLAVDARLFLRMVRTVFDRNQVAVRESGNRGAFIGYGADGRAISEE